MRTARQLLSENVIPATEMGAQRSFSAAGKIFIANTFTNNARHSCVAQFLRSLYRVDELPSTKYDSRKIPMNHANHLDLLKASAMGNLSDS